MEHEPINPNEFQVHGAEEIVRRLPKFFSVSCSSKRNSGKTILTSQFIRQMLKEKKVDVVLVMTGSAGMNRDYDWLPKNLVMPYSERVLNNLWQLQRKTPAKKRKHVLIVFDDVLSTPEAIRSPAVTRLYSLGRHNSCSVWTNSQVSSWLLSPTIKSNSDIILYSALGRNGLENLWESTTNISKKDFIAISEANGGIDFKFMLLDLYNRSTNPREFLAVVKGKAPP
jgi:hypothetical protein